MATLKKAKAVTGSKAQVESPVVESIKTTTVAKPTLDLGFVDYAKSRDTVFEGKFSIIGIQVGPDKVRHWKLVSINPDGTNGKLLGYFGNRKDNKGVYCRSEIKSICSEFKPVVAKEAVAV